MMAKKINKNNYALGIIGFIAVLALVLSTINLFKETNTVAGEAIRFENPERDTKYQVVQNNIDLTKLNQVNVEEYQNKIEIICPEEIYFHPVYEILQVPEEWDEQIYYISTAPLHDQDVVNDGIRCNYIIYDDENKIENEIRLRTDNVVIKNNYGAKNCVVIKNGFECEKI